MKLTSLLTFASHDDDHIMIIFMILMLRCKRIVYPNVFDDKQQYCDTGDNNFCLSKDMNMFCTDVSIIISTNTILSKVITLEPSAAN